MKRLFTLVLPVVFALAGCAGLDKAGLKKDQNEIEKAQKECTAEFIEKTDPGCV